MKCWQYFQAMVAGTLLGVLLAVGGVAPWFFGAWEMWWFWPFVALLSVGALCGGGLIVWLQQGSASHRATLVLWACVPFLCYTLLRWWAGPAVFVDAERAVLLHVSGVLVAALVVFALRDRHVPYLFWGLYSSLAVMSLYGILNHLLTGSQRVLWAPGYAQYAGRATGPYFCPDHFAGAMELLVCMGLGILLDRSVGAGRRLLGGLAVGFGGAAALMSLSRGAGMTLVVIGGLVVIWGFQQWPIRVRWAWRVVCAMAGLLVLAGAFAGAQGYRERFVSYGGLNRVVATSEEPLHTQVVDRLLRTSRGRMFAGSWRSWQTAPWFGIGTGMHRHVWPAVAASGDGDRDAGVWPTLLNDDFHSYEVHSDWLQLLQEYGVVGMGLFLLGFGAVVAFFWQCFREVAQDWTRHELEYLDACPRDYHLVLAGFLALGAMAFHSLGDFNLQMPGTVWMLAILVGLGIRARCRLLEDPASEWPRELCVTGCNAGAGYKA